MSSPSREKIIEQYLENKKIIEDRIKAINAEIAEKMLIMNDNNYNFPRKKMRESN